MIGSKGMKVCGSKCVNSVCRMLTCDYSSVYVSLILGCLSPSTVRTILFSFFFFFPSLSIVLVSYLLRSVSPPKNQFRSVCEERGREKQVSLVRLSHPTPLSVAWSKCVCGAAPYVTCYPCALRSGLQVYKQVYVSVSRGVAGIYLYI